MAWFLGMAVLPYHIGHKDSTMIEFFKKIKPQVLGAILSLFILGVLTITIAPDYIGEVVGSIVTGISVLAMKVIEDSKDE